RCWGTWRRWSEGDGGMNAITRRALSVATSGTIVVALVAGLRAQTVNPAALLNPPADSWLTYHGDYSGQRHSRLTQITPANVGQLALAWAFQTGQSTQIKATPILSNG